MRTFAKLKIVSDLLTPDEIERRVGMRGDRRWLKGDFRGATKIQEKKNGWAIESRCSESSEVADHLVSLLDRVTNFSLEIRSLALEAEIVMTCAIYAADIPSLYFENNLMRRISDLGADFDIDLYLLEDDDV